MVMPRNGDSVATRLTLLSQQAESRSRPLGKHTSARQRELAVDAVLRPLLLRMAQGDESALSSLYDQTVAQVYGLALRIMDNSQEAEEIVSDVYLQAWRQAHCYQPQRARVVGWLLMICRSRALDQLRRRDRADPHPEPENLNRSIGDDPAELLLKSLERGRVHDAIRELSNVQRQMISLAFFYGFTHSEIAARTTLPLGTVKAHIRRGLSILQTLIVEENRQ